MRGLISILLIFIVGVQTVYQGLVYTYYLIDKDFIATNLCENKAVSNSTCAGKCHLRNLMQGGEQIENTTEQKIPVEQFLDLKLPIVFLEHIDFSLTSLWQTNLPSLERGESLDWYRFRYLYQAIFEWLDPPKF
jgi:hypothetical protein